MDRIGKRRQKKNMIIIKRNGQTEPYDIQKIKNAVLLAFKSVGQVYKEEEKWLH